jgi:hypothetical protein
VTELRREGRWPRTLTEGRECGRCYACCKWLGIVELKKHATVTCKHLNGIDPCKRCSIYPSRPKACEEYLCLWRAGVGPDSLYPPESGMLISTYPENNSMTITIVILDEKLARWEPVAMEFLILGFSEVRIVNYFRMTGIMFRGGKVYVCKVLRPTDYEMLSFVADDQPIAGYRLETEDTTNGDNHVAT